MRDFLLSRFQDHPALVAPGLERTFSACLNAAASSPDVERLFVGSGDEDFWPAPDSLMSAYRPYNVRAGVLQVPVSGVLLNNFGYQFGAYATGYQYIEKAISRGLADPNVKGIALLIDSPGGEVAGNFELVDKMFEARGTKPIVAFADSAYSAAFSIASAADSITVSRSGGVGSVGVVTSHIDASKALENDGVKITFIFAGKHKVDGNPYEPLAADVKDRIQARVDRLYGEFVAIVARNRGIEEQAVRDTEALTYSATEALSIGFADKIGALDDAVAAFAADLSLVGEKPMSETKDTAVDQAAIELARDEGIKVGAVAERERISAILGSDAAKNRRETAEHLALHTEMTADQAAALLATLPEIVVQEKADAGRLFDAAMSQDNPDLGALGERGVEETPVAAILADYRAATGRSAR